MKNKHNNLNFINYLKTLERKLGIINEIISNSQQHQDFDGQEVALIKKIYDRLYWSGEVTFDKKNLDASKLKVNL